MAVLSKHAEQAGAAAARREPELKVSAELENAVFRALRKERGERFQHMHDFAAALEQAARDAGASVPALVAAGRRAQLRTAADRHAGGRHGGDAARGGRQRARADAAAQTERGRARTLGARRAAGVRSRRLRRRERDAQRSSDPGSGQAGGPGQAAVAAAEAPQGTPPQPPSAAVDEPALELVTVRVTTEPDGATVRVAGGAEVCATTPCAFEVVRGKAILATGQARRATGDGDVEPVGADRPAARPRRRRQASLCGSPRHGRAQGAPDLPRPALRG